MMNDICGLIPLLARCLRVAEYRAVFGSLSCCFAVLMMIDCSFVVYDCVIY